MPLTVQLLVCPGCAGGAATLELLRELLPLEAPGATLETVLVESAAEAERLGFPGSPTVRVDGRDVEPSPPPGVGLG